MVRKYLRAAEKAGQHHVASRGVRRARRQEVRRNNAKKRAQLKNIPPFAPQYGSAGPIPREWIALPRNGLNQCRLAAAIRTQDAHVLPTRDLTVMSWRATRSPRMTVTCARGSRGAGMA